MTNGYSYGPAGLRLRSPKVWSLSCFILALDHMSLEYFVTDADKLFNLILYSQHSVLHGILPGRSDCNYNLRAGRHNVFIVVFYVLLY